MTVRKRDLTIIDPALTGGLDSPSQHGPFGQGEERRRGGDRRSGRDRRGSGLHQPLSLEPRPYGFREFVERRGRQDRRIYRPESEAWERRGAEVSLRTDGLAMDGNALRSLLTQEEIRFLLRCGRRSRR